MSLPAFRFALPGTDQEPIECGRAIDTTDHRHTKRCREDLIGCEGCETLCCPHCDEWPEDDIDLCAKCRAKGGQIVNEQMSLMELGRRIHDGTISLEDALREMKSESTSVLLGWGEDDGELWECSWIVGGERYTGYHYQPRTAILQAVVECTKALLQRAKDAHAQSSTPLTGSNALPGDAVADCGGER